MHRFSLVCFCNWQQSNTVFFLSVSLSPNPLYLTWYTELNPMASENSSSAHNSNTSTVTSSYHPHTFTILISLKLNWKFLDLVTTSACHNHRTATFQIFGRSTFQLFNFSNSTSFKAYLLLQTGLGTVSKFIFWY